MFFGRAVTNVSGNIRPSRSEIRPLVGPGELFRGRRSGPFGDGMAGVRLHDCSGVMLCRPGRGRANSRTICRRPRVARSCAVGVTCPECLRARGCAQWGRVRAPGELRVVAFRDHMFVARPGMPGWCPGGWVVSGWVVTVRFDTRTGNRFHYVVVVPRMESSHVCPGFVRPQASSASTALPVSRCSRCSPCSSPAVAPMMTMGPRRRRRRRSSRWWPRPPRSPTSCGRWAATGSR